MTAKNFGMGFFGRNPFDKDARKKFKEDWAAMTDSEKLEFMNKRVEACDNNEDRFSVETMDARCEEWMNMTLEEKQAFIDEKKKDFENRMSGMGGGFFGHMHMHR